MNEYRSTETKDLIAALIRARSEFKKPEKSKKANYGSYSTLEDLRAATFDALEKNGLNFDVHYEENENGSMSLVVEITHAPTDQFKKSRIRMFYEKDTWQGLGAASTYAERYCMDKMLGINGMDELDDDGDSLEKTKFQKIKDTITDAQVKIIDDLIGPDDTIYDAFLKSGKIKDLKELKAEHFNKAVEWLEKQKTQCAKATK